MLCCRLLNPPSQRKTKLVLKRRLGQKTSPLSSKRNKKKKKYCNKISYLCSCLKLCNLYGDSFPIEKNSMMENWQNRSNFSLMKSHVNKRAINSFPSNDIMYRWSSFPSDCWWLRQNRWGSKGQENHLKNTTQNKTCKQYCNKLLNVY